MATGTCKLTGEHGKFVRSHLLPQALTRPEGPGAPLIQAGMSARPIRRWTSWYDPRLVTSAGEAILSKHDDSGIKELQRHKLVWSSWGPMVKLESQGFREYRYDDHSMGVRHLTDVDTLTLRMFFLSLLWRAAATDLVEFAEVHLNKEQLSQLTEMILSNNPEPLDFYPIELIQLSTIGIVHNYTPIKAIKRIPAVEIFPEYRVPHLRFYLDGLIIHFREQPLDLAPTAKEMGALIVGGTRELFVTTLPSEGSLQMHNLVRAQANAYTRWPEVMARLEC